jgi:arsenate reductase
MEGQAAPKKRVLIVCTGNSARSQMAEGLLRHEAGDLFDVYSAGTHPGSVRPEAVEVMSAIHIDITGQFSKPVEQFIGQHFDYVITVCDKAKENCPAFPGVPNQFHWPFDDPCKTIGGDDARLAAFRRVRDRIHARLMVFLGESGA